MLGEHAVHHAAVRSKELVRVELFRVPVAVCDLKNVGQAVGHGLVRAEGAEIAAVRVELEHIAHIRAQLDHILALDRAGGRYVERIVAEVRQAQVAQQQTAVGVRVGADAVVALGREFAQLGNQAAVLVEQLFRVVAAQPVVQNLQVLGLIIMIGT